MKALSSGGKLMLFIIIYAVTFDIHKLVVFAGGQINDILFYSILFYSILGGRRVSLEQVYESQLIQVE